MILQAILLGVFLLIGGLIYALAPQIAYLLLGIIGGEQGAYFFLVELPAANVTATGTIGPAIMNVFNLMRNISFILFSVVLVIAGLCYALESFRVVGEGTAANIITGSFFTLIMIFLVIPLYNVVADLFNYLTDPTSNLILGPGMIQTVISAAIRPPGGLTDQIAAFFMAVFFLIMVAVTLIAVGILGTLRIFFVGACLALMPLLLVLRLIPLTKRISESFIEMLLGLTIASLMSAVFLRFGYEVVSTGGFTGLMATIAALGTLISAAMMPTVLAPRLGSLFMTTAGVATAAVSTATIGTVAIAGGAAAGGALGLRHALKLPALSRMDRAELALKGMAMGAAEMAGRGVSSAMTGRSTMFLPGLGRVPFPPAVAKTLAAGGEAAHFSIHSLLEERAGSMTSALMSHLAAGEVIPTATAEHGEALKTQIAGMGDKSAGAMLLERFPELEKHIEDKATVGGEFKKIIAGMPPTYASSFWGRVEQASTLIPEARMAIIKAALENQKENKSKLMERGFPELDLGELDKSPYFAIDIFNPGTLTTKGRIINAKLFQGTFTDYNPNLPREKGEAFAKDLRDKSPRKVAEVISNIVNVPITPREAEMYGPVAMRMLKTMAKNNPVILSNLIEKMKSPSWEKMMSNPRFVERAMKDVEEHRLQAKLATEYMKGVYPVRENSSEKLPEVSLGWLFTEEAKPSQTKVKSQPADVDVSKFFELVDREAAGRPTPWKGSGYTPPKPRKKGEIIAKGSGGDVARQLEEMYGGKLGRKRRGSS